MVQIINITRTMRHEVESRKTSSRFIITIRRVSASFLVTTAVPPRFGSRVTALQPIRIYPRSEDGRSLRISASQQRRSGYLLLGSHNAHVLQVQIWGMSKSRLLSLLWNSHGVQYCTGTSATVHFLSNRMSLFFQLLSNTKDRFSNY
jgi:hypothetical protein